MRRLLVVTLPLLVLSLSFAEEKPTVSLPPKEAAEGWLLLFDGASTFGWDIEGEAKVEKGALVLGGKKKTTAIFKTPFSEFDLHAALAGKGSVLVRANLDVPVVNVGGKVQTVLNLKAEVQRGTGLGLHSESRPGEAGREVVTNASLHHDGTRPVFVGFQVPAGETLALKGLRLKPKLTESLFNGKDLKGWKEHPGKKSKFSVTREGWLNVKDGPGDLQTAGLYDDFVLQLECISNGKHLNSGIFFRCIPGQYQNGYEAQIRNQFTAGAEQKYTVEDYDPKTHKLLGKRTVLSPAVDYGTGAIYRRMPARSEASRDGEWFTLTVAASGRHFATWVNGVPQVDWTDNRPADENPRKGYRAEKGTISIQGHDPTTDLSFRNFRLGVLPGGK